MNTMKEAAEAIRLHILTDLHSSDISSDCRMVTCKNGSVIITEGKTATTFPDCSKSLLDLVSAYNLIVWGKQFTQ